MNEATLPRPTSLQVWRAAIRPATLWAGAVPVFVGTALAFADGFRAWLPALAALVGAILIQIGTNLVNDYADFATGADGPDRLGPPRATAQGWLTARQVATGAALALAGATGVGVYIVWVGGWPMFWVGVASLICAVAYTAGPFPLGYHGLGDLFVFLFFGLAAVCGTYYLQTGLVSVGAICAAVSVGAFATAILVVNNLRDRHTDARVGKRTLAVRLGAGGVRAEYVLLMVLGYGAVIYAVGWRHGGAGWLLSLASLPIAWRETRAVLHKDGAALNPHLGGAARLELVFGVLLSLGALLW